MIQAIYEMAVLPTYLLLTYPTALCRSRALMIQAIYEMAVLPTYLLLTYPQPFEKPSIMIQAIYEMAVLPTYLLLTYPQPFEKPSSHDPGHLRRWPSYLLTYF